MSQASSGDGDNYRLEIKVENSISDVVSEDCEPETDEVIPESMYASMLELTLQGRGQHGG